MSGLFANALSFIVSAACLTRIRVAEPAPQPRPAHASLRAEISDGIRFLVRDPRLRAVAAYMGTGNFGDSMLEAVVIVFLVRTVKVGPGLAGNLVATMGVGGVCGAMLATRIGLRLGTARGMLVIRGTQPLGAVAGEALGPRAAMWIAAGAITLSAGILFIGPLRHERDLPAAHPANLAAQPAA